MTFLIDSGADISVIATNKSLLDRNACKTVSGIGGNQLIGPKKKFCIRFACNQNREYDAWLSPTVLDSNQELVILGRDFLNQFDSTEFDWCKSKVRLGNTWLFYMDAEEKSWDIGEQISSEEKQQAIALLLKFQEVFVHNSRLQENAGGLNMRLKCGPQTSKKQGQANP